MESVIRGLAVFFFLLIVFRLAGKRTLSDASTFDFVLLLIISETTQQALIGNDFSVTGAFIVIATLVGAAVVMEYLTFRSKRLKRVIDGLPVVLVDHGKVLKDRMNANRVDEDDILEAARMLHGLERIEQVKYAVLERNGGISIIPLPEQK